MFNDEVVMYVFSSGPYTSFPANGLSSPRAVLVQPIPPRKQRGMSLLKGYPKADDKILSLTLGKPSFRS